MIDVPDPYKIGKFKVKRGDPFFIEYYTHFTRCLTDYESFLSDLITVDNVKFTSSNPFFNYRSFSLRNVIQGS